MPSLVVQQARQAARALWATGDFDILASQASHPAAMHLVRAAGVQPGDQVLDVATGTGAVALAAARAGARVTGQDVTPELLVRAERHAELAGLEAHFEEGDAQAMPYADDYFDVVLSQFGHMFAPDPAATIGEMLRVLKPGGRLAFNTWPPEMMVGQIFQLAARYVPPPKDAPSPVLWGSPDVVRERLADRVEDITFYRDATSIVVPSPQHFRHLFESVFGPTMRLVEALKDKPERLAGWRREHDALVAGYFDGCRVRQDYLMTVCTKRG